MKKNLHPKFMVSLAIFFLVTLTLNAQNTTRNPDMEKKIKQLNEYLQSHPLAPGQTNFAAQQLEKFKANTDDKGYYVPANSAQQARINSDNHVTAPSNDDCANAILLTENATCIATQGDVAAATESMPAGTCGIYTSVNGYDVWYKFVAVTAAPYIEVTGSSEFDAIVFLFDACGGTVLGCSDATVNGGTEVISATGLTPGNTYYIRVYDYGDALPPTTTFDICVQSFPSAPANDACASATSLTMSPDCNPVNASLGGATDDGIPGCSGTADDDVWFYFVATAPRARITVTSLEAFNTVVEVFDGCGGTSLFCSDVNTNGNEAIDTLPLTVSNTYYIRVYTYDAGGAIPGNFNICVWEVPPPPANDECANAILLTENATCITTQGDVDQATQSMPPDLCNTFTSGTGYDVWYQFVAASTDPFITVTGSAEFDAVVFLFDGCGGSVLFCSDATTGGEAEVITSSGLTIGNTYYVRVYPYGISIPSTTTFDICVSSSEPTGIHENADRSNSISIYPNPSSGFLNVDLGIFSQKSIVKIYDLPGNLLKEETIQNARTKKLDVSDLANGVYLIKIENENGVVSRKITLKK